MNFPTKVQSSTATQSFTPVQQTAKADKPAVTVVEAGKADSLGFGERFVHGTVQGAKAAAIPAMVAATAGLIASDPDYAGLAMLAGPAIGILGAGGAGLIVGGTANALGANKATATLGGAAAGAAAGWALNNTSSPKVRMLTAGAGAIIGGASGYAGSGARISGDKLINNFAGGTAGAVAAAGLAIALSGGKDLGGLANLAVFAAGAGGFALTHQLQK